MGNKIVTEAMRKATPQLPGAPRIKQGAGQKVKVEYWRDGKQQTTEITLGTPPAN